MPIEIPLSPTEPCPELRQGLTPNEYFHGDNGAGLGASHQTGWTGLIARTLDLFARLKPEDVLRAGKGIMAEMTREPSCRSEESTANGQDSRRGQFMSLANRHVAENCSAWCYSNGYEINNIG